MRQVLLSFLTLAIILPVSAEALPPLQIIYGGRLSDSGGNAIVGPAEIRLTFYEDAGKVTKITIPNPEPDASVDDSLVYSAVDLVDGIFDLDLELSPAQYDAVFGDDASSTAVFIHLEYCLGTCGGHPINWVTTLDLQQYTYSPYALKIPIFGSNLD